MSAERQRTIEGIFLEVVKDPEKRDAILRERCAADQLLRAEVLELLDHHAPASFLDPDELRLADAAMEEPTLPPGTRIGSYVLDTVLGSGGMGVVYVARQERPRRTVALKLIRRTGNGAARRRRFEREAELLGRLQHPGVAQIFEAGVAELVTPEGPVVQPFLAMELIAGQPLTEYVRSTGLDVAERLRLMVKICVAVDHAHQRGVVHRDLKPANILVDQSGQPKVLDFGVARATGADVQLSSLHTRHGQLIGTLTYMSPEQVTGRSDELDARADVYALGCLLYEVLVGRPPLDLTNLPLPEAARRILDHEPPPLSAHDRKLRGGLQVIASQALAKDKTRRYATAADLAADLEAFLAGRPIAAEGVSALELVTRKLRRYRGIVALSSASLLILLVVAGYALNEAAQNRWLARRVQTELAASNIERGRLLGKTGGLVQAEDLLWREHVRGTAPRQTLWALWELYEREACCATVHAHDGPIQTLAFTDDGRTLATGGVDGKVRLWDASSAQPRATFAPDVGPISDLSFTRYGLVVAGAQGAVWSLDATTGAVVQRFDGLTGDVQALAVAPDQDRLAGGSFAGVVCVWDLTSGQLRARHECKHRVSAVCFSPDGSLLASAHHDGRVRLCARGGLEAPVTLPAQPGGARSLDFSRDGRTLLIGGVDRDLSVWDLAQQRCTRTLQTTSGTVKSVHAMRDGRTLLTSGYWSADLWDLESGRRVRALPGFMSNSRLARDEHMIALACENGAFRLWDLADDASGLRLTTTAAPHAGRTVARLSGDGCLVASGDERGTVKLWEAATGRCLASWAAHPGRVRAVRFGPDGRHLATAGADAAIHVWDLVTGARVATCPEANARTCDTFDFSPDGRCLAYVTGRGGFAIRDARSGALQASLPDAAAEALSVRYLPDGRSLMVVRRNEPPRLWTPGGDLVELPATQGATWSVASDPDGARLALGTWGQAIEIVDVASRRCTNRLVGHHGVIAAVEFRPGDARLVASASTDGTIRLWDIETSQCLATLDAFGERPVMSIDFSADGRLLVAGGDEGGLRLWDLDRAVGRVAGNAAFQVERIRRVAGLPGDADVVASTVATLTGMRAGTASSSRPGVDPERIARWGTGELESRPSTR